jgi:uncharacterized protein YndB with AHSA1/START domain
VSRAEHSIEIARPPEDVFPLLVRPEEMKRWVGGLLEFTPLDGGEPRPGARSRQRVEQAGRTWTVESELTELRPNELLATRMKASAFTSTLTYRLEPVGALATRLVATVETQVHGLGGRLLAPIAARQAERKLGTDLGRLKTLLERDPTG